MRSTKATGSRGPVVFRIDAARRAPIDQPRQRRDGEGAESSAQLTTTAQDAARARLWSEDVLDQTKSALDALTSQVAQAQAAVGLAQRYLGNMVVTSPIDGVVSEKKMNIGEIATMMPPSVVIVVQDIDALELRARLPETALKTVRAGAQINVSFPATGETRTVTIKRIAPTVDVRTRTIEIIAEIPNADNALKAGMLAEVAYSGAEQASTATTPEAAKAKPAPVAAKEGGNRASR